MEVLRVMAGVYLKLITVFEGPNRRFLESLILKKAYSLLAVELVWSLDFLFLDLLLIIFGEVGLSYC